MPAEGWESQKGMIWRNPQHELAHNLLIIWSLYTEFCCDGFCHWICFYHQMPLRTSANLFREISKQDCNGPQEGGKLKAMPNWGSFFTPGILKWLTGVSDNIPADFLCIIAIHFAQMYSKVAFIPKQHTQQPFWLRHSVEMLPTAGLSQVCHHWRCQPSLGSLTLLTPLRQGASSPSLQGERNHPVGGHECVWGLPGSYASVLRTAKLRSDKPTVMVQRRQSRGHERPSVKAGDKQIRAKAKTQCHEAEVRLIN